jgi:hypothetical protein
MNETFLFLFLALGSSAAERSFTAPLSAQAPEAKTDCEDQTKVYIIADTDVETGRAAEKAGEIRDFIWQHWHRRERGCLTEKRYSKEGQPTLTTFILANDQASVWSLTVTRHWPLTKGADEAHTHVEYRAYAVRRTGNSKDAIPEDEIRSGVTYRLFFFDAKGAETGRF